MEKQLLMQALEQSIKETYDLGEVVLREISEHDGSINTVFHVQSPKAEGYARVTQRVDRDYFQLVEEIHFINHLDLNDVSVVKPFMNKLGHYVSSITHLNEENHYVLFHAAPGEQLSHRGYKYIEGVPLRKHHYNCGHLLGKLHKASQTFSTKGAPTRESIVSYLTTVMETYLPPDMIEVREKFNSLIGDLDRLNKDSSNYGMIHGDFGDGNYTINYQNGNITLFDFDDSGECWYMYELACAWAASMGWVMHEQDLVKREQLMSEIFSYIVEGYRSVKHLDDDSVDQLPLFLRLVQMEWFLGELKYSAIKQGAIDFTEEEIQEHIHYILNDIPYLGLFEDD